MNKLINEWHPRSKSPETKGQNPWPQGSTQERHRSRKTNISGSVIKNKLWIMLVIYIVSSTKRSWNFCQCTHYIYPKYYSWVNSSSFSLKNVFFFFNLKNTFDCHYQFSKIMNTYFSQYLQKDLSESEMLVMPHSLRNPTDYSPQGSSLHIILQARILD